MWKRRRNRFTCPRLSMRQTSSWPRKHPLVNETASISSSASCGMVLSSMSTGWQRDAAFDAERLEHVGPDGGPAVGAQRGRHRVDPGPGTDEVEAHLGADDEQLARGQVAVELRRDRPRPLIEHLGPDERHHGPLVGAVDHFRLHPDLEAVERGLRAARRGRGRCRATARRRPRAGGTPTSSFPCGVRSNEARARARRSSGSRSADTNAWRNEHASSPVTSTKPRSGDRRGRRPGATWRALRFRSWRSRGSARGARPRAAAAAVSNARALLWHSWSSSAGIESATIPAPAWTLAWPSRQTIVRIAIAVSRLPEKSTYPTTPA